MSNSHLFLKSGFPRAPLQNGVGRYVCQLQRITLKFCKSHGNSRGVREFIEHDLVDFAKANPGIVVYLKPRRHRTAVMTAEYLNGDRQWVSCRDYNRDEIIKWIHMLKSQNGNSQALRYRKRWHTDFPSIQGPWTPFTLRNPELNQISFPDKSLSTPLELEPTATEQLLELFKKQQISDKSENENKNK
uniref:Large ribosomal subunit protein mL43 n=1 Tax=Xenopsylla cheopis TaxID=163159 RepID=A0A6M2DMX8_XENCH